MKISIGSDHAGFDYKNYIVQNLLKAGHLVTDRGPGGDAPVDYPDYAHPVAIDVESKVADLGILICGSGNGVCLTANKHRGIRAALCWKVTLAELSRKHNDANILCLPARFISKRMAANIVKAFLSTDFEGGRHTARVQKISGC
jgi:ribose 5-phosphate isomerase B